MSVNPTLRVHLFPYETQTTGSDFVIRVGAMRYIAVGETIDKTIDQNNLDNTVTVDDVIRTTTTFDQALNAGLMSAGDWVSGEIERRATDGGDDRNGDCGVFLIEFIYTANKLGG